MYEIRFIIQQLQTQSWCETFKVISNKYNVYGTCTHYANPLVKLHYSVGL
jgi:hypothetical protein